jgi:hypothetical protein
MSAYNPEFNHYFDYFWLELYLTLNKKIDITKSYYPLLYKQLKKCLYKLLKFNPEIFENKHYYHTFKRPHSSSLIKWRITLRDYLRRFFNDNPHLNKHKLIIFREFHVCRLDCHYIKVYNYKFKEWEKKHKKEACHCNDNGNYYNHKCKHDIHKMIISSMELNFSSWPHGYDKQIVDPNELCVNEDAPEDKDLSLRHPVTNEIVDEMTKIICYANKDAEGRFINPNLYKRHDDNPNREYFDIFNYQTDLAYRNWKSDYNKHYKQEKKVFIKQCFSYSVDYRILDNKIRYLNNKIAKSRSENNKILRIERTKLVFEFKLVKEELIKQILPLKKIDNF